MYRNIYGVNMYALYQYSIQKLKWNVIGSSKQNYLYNIWKVMSSIVLRQSKNKDYFLYFSLLGKVCTTSLLISYNTIQAEFYSYLVHFQKVKILQ